MTCGVSGSGKTSSSREIAQAIESLHIRSDIERKRIAGLKALDRSDKTIQAALYSEEMGRLTYKRLLDIAEICINEGVRVIVDATFLKIETRRLFIELAGKQNCCCRVLHFDAPKEVLLQRVQSRYLRGDDASEADIAVLASQLERFEPFSKEEREICIKINTAERYDIGEIIREINSSLQS